MNNVADWTSVDYYRYINKGTHHISWLSEGDPIKGHVDLARKIVAEWPETKKSLRDRIGPLTKNELLDALSDLMHFPAPAALSRPRLDFIVRLLECRLSTLKELLL